MRVAAVVITACECEGWFARVSALPVPSVVLTPPGAPDLRRCTPRVVAQPRWAGHFNWGALSNLAAEEVAAEWLWFQHDDVTPPTVEELNRMIDLCEAADAPLAVPRLVGFCSSPRQGLALGGWSHMTELATSGALLIRRAAWEELGRFPTTLPGYGFSEPHLQFALMRARGSHGILVHEVTLTHTGGGTYGARYTKEARRRMVLQAALASAKVFNIRLDARSRIGMPRLLERVPGCLKVEEYDDHIMVGTLRAQIRGDEAEDELLDVAANHSTTESFEFRGKTYHRFPVGHKLAVTGKAKEVYVAAYRALGLGDAFFAMKAFQAIREHLPEMRIVVCSDLNRAPLFERCADVDEVRNVPWGRCPLEAFDIHRIGAWGRERGPEIICHYFGVPYGRQPGRYTPRAEDFAEAERLLLEAGWDVSRPLLCLQMHGGWPAKRWRNTAQFARQAAEQGVQIWYAGLNAEPRLRVGEPVIAAQAASLPTLVAMIALCDIVVGFDSGITHAAACLGVPLVSLWGPHDPGGMLLDAEVHNVVAIRKRLPWRDCGQLHCRVEGGGTHCPLRPGDPGGDCLDEVTPAEVWQHVHRIIKNAYPASALAS